MSRPIRIPSYRRHKQSGQAVVTLTIRGRRRDIFLGAFGSPESHREYARVVAEWTGSVAGPIKSDHDQSVNELLLAFWQFAITYYRRPDGRPSTEVHNYRAVIRTVRILYGATKAVDFGPVALKTVRQHWITAGIVRTQVNARVYRVRRIFRWAVGEQLMPPATYEALRAVEGLKAGRTEAKDSEPVTPVPDEQVAAVMPYLPAIVRAMVRVQQLSGMRPGEVCRMKWSEIDRSGQVWTYKPSDHKTAHHEKDRVIFLGPKAQAILAGYADDPSGYVFPPRRSEATRHRARSSDRKTPRYPSHLRRNASKRKARPRRSAGECYTQAAYRRAIARACEQAWPPPGDLARRLVKASDGRSKQESVTAWKARLGPKGLADVAEWRARHSWSPHQLRHSAATRISTLYGREAARTVLGHAEIGTTEIYVARDLDLAARVAAEIG